LVPKKSKDGGIWFYDRNETPIFVLPPPYAYDSSAEKTPGHAWYTLDRTEARTVITLSLDESWARAPERVYPITIDPTTLNVASGLGGNQNYYFEIPFAQTFSYNYSGYGHASLFTSDC